MQSMYARFPSVLWKIKLVDVDLNYRGGISHSESVFSAVATNGGPGSSGHSEGPIKAKPSHEETIQDLLWVSRLVRVFRSFLIF